MARPSYAAAFMAAARDRPDDPLPWRAFADWLAERGHPLRVEHKLASAAQ